MTADNENLDAVELASAYLDGDVTDDERARVAADPALRAEVERLRRVRAAVGEVTAAPTDAREVAIAAALAAFDEAKPTAGAAPPNVVPLERRRRARQMQIITAVAAAAVLVVGGFVIANRDGDDDTATVREAPVSAGLGERDAALAPAPTTTSVAGPTTTVAAAAELAIATEPAGSIDAPLAAPQAAAGEEEDSVQDAAAAATTTVLVRDAEELAELAAELTTAPLPVDEIVARCEERRTDVDADATFVDAAGDRVPIAVGSTPDGFAAVSLRDCTVVVETT